MNKSKNYSDKLQNFANRVKSEPTQLPIQKVTPLEKPIINTKEEQQLNVWIPKDLMKRLKIKGVELNKSLKEMVIESLDKFL